MSFVFRSTDAHIEDPGCLHIHRLPPRANLIPAAQRGVYFRNKEQSPFIRLLNGEYLFRYLPNDTDEPFFVEAADEGAWDTIDVPSMWQYRGYGSTSYTNIRYPFPFMPPYILRDNPVGLYRRHFTVDTPAERTLLHFCGVDNAFYVYLNGVEVGFSKGSRLPAEFDVTHLVRAGDNVLAVKVFTYSDASYLENQDMLPASGIFRDVYLIETRASTLWDFRSTTTEQSFTVALSLRVASSFEVSLTLDGQTVTYPAAERITHTFHVPDAKTWCAEEPNLYDLYIELRDASGVFEVHSKRVGIMHTRVEGNRLLVNGKPIYIKGICRHENDPWNGRTLSVEAIERDLRLIKENHLNAVRLAHYTNHPATYEIAAELGLYLMDEADLETHGAYVAGDQGLLSKDPAWLPAYMDRIQRMLESNKNEVAIFLWSTGNEAGTGCNLDRCVDYIRAFDPSRECIITQDTGEYTHFRKIAYYPMAKTEEYADAGYPVLAIEYAHAMGNGPGGLAAYWDYNYTHEKMLGGFVWELRNHGFGRRDSEGRVYYAYGGDFEGDTYHWSNFSLDGFCTSDGTPKPSWAELGHVLFAAHATLSGNVLTVMNTNDFRDLSYLVFSYEIEEDGRGMGRRPLALPPLFPHERTELLLDLTVKSPASGARYTVSVYAREGEREVWRKQFDLGVLRPHAAPRIGKAMHASVRTQGSALTVEGDFGVCRFERGLLCHLSVGGDVLLDRPMSLNLCRAFTDNDGVIGYAPRHVAEWEDAQLPHYSFRLHDVRAEELDRCVRVEAAGAWTANSVYAGFTVRLVYGIYPTGTVTVTLSADPYGDLPVTLPRIGVTLPLSKCHDRCAWVGRGPAENYSDIQAAAPIGRYELPLSEMNFSYDVPQETGNREDVRALTVTGEVAPPLSVVGQDSFAFSYHDVTLENLTAARHKNEIMQTKDVNYLYIDYKMRGIGSRSCGPDPEEGHELYPHPFTFSFALCRANAEEALALSRLRLCEETRARGGKHVYTPTPRVTEVAACDLD